MSAERVESSLAESKEQLAREQVCVCVCVCVRERERERESSDTKAAI